MVHAASLSLPLKLKTAAEVLKTGEQKDDAGEKLIKYFSVPCKATKANGGRTRNLPEHAPEDWQKFKDYCKQDVRTERDIRKVLERIPILEHEWDYYHMDQRINDRGVLIDRQLVEQAITCDLMLSEAMSKKAYELTGLENPNSVSQLKQWLEGRGISVESLGKKDVATLISDLDKHSLDSEALDMLKLRLQMAKSSVKKYQAADRCICNDGRARGLFQFSGANRTQRWCLTGDHEVLTQNGWVRFDVWDGSPILCWNAQSEAVSFQKVKKLCFDYEGPMYTYTDKRIDQCSTPDHKMRVQKRYGAPWQDMTVEEMAKYRPCIPMNGYRYHRGCANPDWIRVLVMAQADATYTTDGAVKFHFKKQRKIERCKSLLRKAAIPFVEHQYSVSTTIDIPARAVPLWLREFRTKTFGFWLLDENPDIFFDELPNWDGSRPAPNSIQYCTANKQNADIVQALAHMSGRCCSMVLKHRPEHPEWADAYYLNIWLAPGNCHEVRVKPQISDFAGKVYCAETSTGYFLVRRNGKVWVTGNSGRLLQLQNLPQNHISTLDEARELVKMGCFDMAESIYGNTPDILSQLIRTMLIAKPDHEFIVADFSAIEARVLAWLSGEQWRLDSFKRGEDIYCASASQMFGVPVVKHGVNGELRQKGKVAELACIAEGSMVLTDKGLVPIEEVTLEHRLWDGENWVEHEGVIYKGEREVITYEGLTATEDHLVWIEGKSEPIQFGLAAASGAHLIQTGDGRRAIRLGENNKSGERMKEEKLEDDKTRLYDIRNAGRHHRFTVSGRLVHNCGYGGAAGALISMGALDMGLKEEELPDLIEDWRNSNPKIVQFWWDIEKACIDCVKDHMERKVKRIGISFSMNTLWLTLPSGRRLAYIKPKLQPNRFGRISITYEGLGSNNKWQRQETYSGKLVENCIAKGTEVLTNRGLIPIESVITDDLIWDGEEWASHEGLIDKGLQDTVAVCSGGHYDGVHMTADHKILTEEGWCRCGESTGFDWASVSLPDCPGKGSREHKSWWRSMALQVCMWKGKDCSRRGFDKEEISNKVMRLHGEKTHSGRKSNTWYEQPSSLGCMAFNEAAVYGFKPPCLSQLWWSWNNCLSGVAGKFRELLVGYGKYLSAWIGSRQNRQQQGVLKGKLPMGKQKREQPESENKPDNRYSLRKNDRIGTGGTDHDKGKHPALSAGSRLADRITVHSTKCQEQVYDIRNCGQRHRFCVFDRQAGKLRIVSNCTQATARDLLAEAMWRMEQAGIGIVGHVHDEVILEVPTGTISVDDVCAIMNTNPEWADGLPLNSAGYRGFYYFKD
jgi:hypothetical protein